MGVVQKVLALRDLEEPSSRKCKFWEKAPFPRDGVFELAPAFFCLFVMR